MEETQENSLDVLQKAIVPEEFAAPATVIELLEKYCAADENVIIIEKALQHIGRHLPETPQTDPNDEIVVGSLQKYFEATVNKFRFISKQKESATSRDQYGAIIEGMMHFFSGSFKHIYKTQQFLYNYMPKTRLYIFSLDAQNKLFVTHDDKY